MGTRIYGGVSTVPMLCEFASVCLSAAVGAVRECDDAAGSMLGLAGRARLLARRGEERECRACAAEALRLSQLTGAQRDAFCALAALGELELGLGNATKAVEHLERQQELLADHRTATVDLSPAAELVDAYVRLGLVDEARRIARDFTAAAISHGRPWSLARALRCQGQLAEDREFTAWFEQALRYHAHTTDMFEAARTRLAYGNGSGEHDAGFLPVSSYTLHSRRSSSSTRARGPSARGES
jgi:tetratricopeptide (TPR) repeat protein